MFRVLLISFNHEFLVVGLKKNPSTLVLVAADVNQHKIRRGDGRTVSRPSSQ